MLVVGVAGGIASGKSLVAEQFKDLGAAVLDADRLGHKVLQEAEIINDLVERFGNHILDKATQQIDRSKLARLVFAPPPQGAANLSYLEQLTHPRIREQLKEEITRLASDNAAVAILDAPVMFKAGWDSVCDHIVFVDAPEVVRMARANSRGWTQKQFRAREQAQTPLAVKSQQSDFIIDNSGTPEETFRQVRKIWEQLT